MGIENYAFVLEDRLTRTAFRNTFYFSALSVACGHRGGTGIALLLDSEAPGTRVLLAAAVLPWAIPEVVNALMWKWIFDYNWGALNALLVAVGASPSTDPGSATARPQCTRSSSPIRGSWCRSSC